MFGSFFHSTSYVGINFDKKMAGLQLFSNSSSRPGGIQFKASFMSESLSPAAKPM
jgi:hypothetical protein